jgi:hypothetical protein
MTDPTNSDEQQFEREGFVEILDQEGMTTAAEFTAGCSGLRSACCTRTCSSDPTFVGTAQDWDAFLSVKGGEIQY